MPKSDNLSKVFSQFVNWLRFWSKYQVLRKFRAKTLEHLPLFCLNKGRALTPLKGTELAPFSDKMLADIKIQDLRILASYDAKIRPP